MKYEIVRNMPAAKFRYKGNHSKAVRRTVLVTGQDRNTLVGYEIREGNEVRDWDNAPIKTFTRDKMEAVERLSMEELIENGY